MNADDGKQCSAVRQELERRLSPHGQEHLLRFWSELDECARRRLAEQIAAIDFSQVQRLTRGLTNAENWAEIAQRAEPPDAFRLEGRGNRFSIDEARVAGEQALAQGKVGAILVAGGQGSRMGFDKPKGMYPIGPVSGASLFQILFEKLRAVRRRYRVSIPLFVMTSRATHEVTEQYLNESNYFGLPPGEVKLFRQGVMPAVDAATGRVLLADKGEISLSPDGHGGMLAAFDRSGGMNEIRRLGIKHLFYFQVDNPQVEMCDAVFLGYHLLAKSEMSTLAVAKRDPLERLGNVVRVDGRTQIIEYSDLPEDVARLREADGTLRFWAGSIAVHWFDVAFLDRVRGSEQALPFHVAKKKVPYVDEAGQCVTPNEPNAVKFERFIFDLLPSAERPIVVEADPARTFAPVKNAPGETVDSPNTCRAAMVALHREWLTQCGAKVAEGAAVEISPLFALDAAELSAKLQPGTRFDRPTYLHDVA